jgi:hypothetical protein
MTNREVGRLSCKVLSICTVIGFIASLTFPISTLQLSMLEPPRGHQGSTSWLLSLIPPILLLVLSACLWFGAEALAAHMISGAESSERASSVTPEVIQRIAFAVAGILIFAGAISPLVRLIQQISYRILNSRVPMMDDLGIAMLVVEVMIRLALGVWLLFGAESVSRLLQLAKPLVKKDW